MNLSHSRLRQRNSLYSLQFSRINSFDEFNRLQGAEPCEFDANTTNQTAAISQASNSHCLVGSASEKNNINSYSGGGGDILTNTHQRQEVVKGESSSRKNEQKNIQGYTYKRLKIEESLPQPESYELKLNDLDFLAQFNQERTNTASTASRRIGEEECSNQPNEGDSFDGKKGQMVSESQLSGLLVHFERKSTRMTTATREEVLIEYPTKGLEGVFSTQEVFAVYEYWKKERENEKYFALAVENGFLSMGGSATDKYPLLRRHWRALADDLNLHAAFRPREAARMRTRKSAVRDTREMQDRVIVLSHEFGVGKTLLSKVVERERLKRSISVTEVQSFLQRVPSVAAEFKMLSSIPVSVIKKVMSSKQTATQEKTQKEKQSFKAPKEVKEKKGKQKKNRESVQQKSEGEGEVNEDFDANPQHDSLAGRQEEQMPLVQEEENHENGSNRVTGTDILEKVQYEPEILEGNNEFTKNVIVDNDNVQIKVPKKQKRQQRKQKVDVKEAEGENIQSAEEVDVANDQYQLLQQQLSIVEAQKQLSEAMMQGEMEVEVNNEAQEQKQEQIEAVATKKRKKRATNPKEKTTINEGVSCTNVLATEEAIIADVGVRKKRKTNAGIATSVGFMNEESAATAMSVEQQQSLQFSVPALISSVNNGGATNTGRKYKRYSSRSLVGDSLQQQQQLQLTYSHQQEESQQIEIEKGVLNAQIPGFVANLLSFFTSENELPVSLEQRIDLEGIRAMNERMKEAKKVRIKIPNLVEFAVRQRYGRSKRILFDRLRVGDENIYGGATNGRVSYVLDSTRKKIIFNTLPFWNTEINERCKQYYFDSNKEEEEEEERVEIVEEAKEEKVICLDSRRDQSISRVKELCDGYSRNRSGFESEEDEKEEDVESESEEFQRNVKRLSNRIQEIQQARRLAESLGLRAGGEKEGDSQKNGGRVPLIGMVEKVNSNPKEVVNINKSKRPSLEGEIFEVDSIAVVSVEEEKSCDIEESPQHVFETSSKKSDSSELEQEAIVGDTTVLLLHQKKVEEKEIIGRLESFSSQQLQDELRNESKQLIGENQFERKLSTSSSQSGQAIVVIPAEDRKMVEGIMNEAEGNSQHGIVSIRFEEKIGFNLDITEVLTGYHGSDENNQVYQGIVVQRICGGEGEQVLDFKEDRSISENRSSSSVDLKKIITINSKND